MVVIKVKNKHYFLYQLTLEIIKQIPEEQGRQTVTCAKLQKPRCSHTIHNYMEEIFQKFITVSFKDKIMQMY